MVSCHSFPHPSGFFLPESIKLTSSSIMALGVPLQIHQTSLSLNGNTISGVSGRFFVGCHWWETWGYRKARECS